MSNIHYRIRTWIKKYPFLYFPVSRLFHNYGEAFGYPVTKESDMVVEGFPRSGNTFAITALRLSQTSPLKIATHMHAAAQVIRGCKLGKPVLVIIRQPEDAVISYIIHRPELGLQQALQEYIAFYTAIYSWRNNFLCVKFEDVITDFGKVIERINYRFNLQLEPFVHSEENVEKCFSSMEQIHLERRGSENFEQQVTRPSQQRDETKAELKSLLEQPEYSSALQKARTLYNRYSSYMQHA